MTNQKHLLAALLAATAVAAIFSYPADAATKKVVYVPRKLDGVYDVKSRANYWPVAVMIDNHTAARPQSGLQQASFVYEALAEGGIPRFMAVFTDMNVARIGPVRSVRPYFADYAAEYRAPVVHAGGSPDGLKEVMKQRLVSLEGIKGKYAKFFFRALGGGVHGLYTNSVNLIKALKLANVWGKKPTYQTYQSYKFKDDTAVSHRGRTGSGVTIDLGYGRAYDIQYKYNKNKNVYLRFTGYQPHRDRLTGKQITIKNVIVINVPKEKVLDKKGRLQLKTVGKGTGYVLQNGKLTKITWEKKSTSAHTVFKTLDKKELKLIRGNTWITVVPKGHQITFF